MGYLLDRSDEPLSFVVVIPEMGMSPNLASAYACTEPYLTRRATAHAGDHSYLMGLQHQQTGDGRFWTPQKASVMYFFQNTAGALRWPVRDDLVKRLLAAFRAPP